jgi:hypothetical protein
MPDLTFSDLDYLRKTVSFNVVILPENKQSLARLESDPRLHNFLRHVIATQGRIVAGAEGRHFLKKLSVGVPGLGGSNGEELLLLPREQGQSVEMFARDLLYWLGQPVRP